MEWTLDPAIAAPQVTSVLKTDGGPVRGVEQGAMNAYLGIPYAAPPVGNLRWMPPKKPASWTSVLDASKFASSCAQNADLGVFAKAGGTEDYRPEISEKMDLIYKLPGYAPAD